jgi:hypothetical protein
MEPKRAPAPCYFAPDSCEWESLGRGYSDFLEFCLLGDLARFYESFRWPGWQEEIATLGGSQALIIYPFLSAKGPPIGERSRSPGPIEEIYASRSTARRRLAHKPVSKDA